MIEPEEVVLSRETLDSSIIDLSNSDSFSEINANFNILSESVDGNIIIVLDADLLEVLSTWGCSNLYQQLIGK